MIVDGAREAAERLYLPFPILSDSQIEFVRARTRDRYGFLNMRRRFVAVLIAAKDIDRCR